MEKEIIEKTLEHHKSIRKSAKVLGIGYSTLRYWIEKLDVSIEKKEISERRCPRCKKNKEMSSFYNRRGGKGSSAYCKPCTIDQTVERQRAFKSKCVEYKGGKCFKCGYSRSISALEFHHIDPSEKDFSISNAKLTSINERIYRELDKCILVCANCHREIHDEMVGLPEFESGMSL